MLICKSRYTGFVSWFVKRQKDRSKLLAKWCLNASYQLVQQEFDMSNSYKCVMIHEPHIWTCIKLAALQLYSMVNEESYTVWFAFPTVEIFWLQSWFSRFWRHIRSQWRGAPSSRHPAAENYIFIIKRIMFDTIMNLFWTQIDKDINLTKKMFSSPILTHPSVCSDVRASPEHFEVKSWSWVTHRYISIFI